MRWIQMVAGDTIDTQSARPELEGTRLGAALDRLLGLPDRTPASGHFSDLQTTVLAKRRKEVEDEEELDDEEEEEEDEELEEEDEDEEDFDEDDEEFEEEFDEDELDEDDDDIFYDDDDEE